MSYELHVKLRQKINEKTLTREEWEADWKYNNDRYVMYSKWRFRIGHLFWRWGRKLKRYGWKQMAISEARFLED